MNARWVQLQATPNSMYSPPPAWVAVDEDEEILAVVTQGNSMWAAYTGDGMSAGAKRGSFLSEAAAKRKVEKWLHPVVFPAANLTAWVYQVTP